MNIEDLDFVALGKCYDEELSKSSPTKLVRLINGVVGSFLEPPTSLINKFKEFGINHYDIHEFIDILVDLGHSPLEKYYNYSKSWDDKNETSHSGL